MFCSSTVGGRSFMPQSSCRTTRTFCSRPSSPAHCRRSPEASKGHLREGSTSFSGAISASGRRNHSIMSSGVKRLCVRRASTFVKTRSEKVCARRLMNIHGSGASGSKDERRAHSQWARGRLRVGPTWGPGPTESRPYVGQGPTESRPYVGRGPTESRPCV